MQLSALEYLQAGQMPFFRLPTVQATPAGLDGVGAAFLGVTYDAGTTYQPGARFAPFHVRRLSALVQPYHPVHRVDVFRAVKAVDAGNVAFPPFEPAAMRAAVEASVATVLAAKAVPFLVGGDHSIALPALRAVAKARGPVCVVHLDAHLDTSGPEVWGTDHHHGTPLRHALQEKLVDREGYFQVGLRGPWGSDCDRDLADANGARIFTSEEVHGRGAGAIASEIRERVRGRPVYLTLDVDGIDPAFAPGTGTPVPGGLSSAQALGFLRGLAGVDVAGMDVVEVCPPLDHADLTSLLASHLLFEGLSLLAARRR